MYDNMDKWLFELGVKPAVMCKQLWNWKETDKDKIKETVEFKEYKDSYPYILFPHRNAVVFFKTEEEKQRFWEMGVDRVNTERFGLVDDYNQQVLGEVLGYPPLASKSFVEDNCKKDGEYEPRTLVNYYGIKFSSRVSEVDECLQWMKENRPMPDEVKEVAKITVGK